MAEPRTTTKKGRKKERLPTNYTQSIPLVIPRRAERANLEFISPLSKRPNGFRARAPRVPE